MLSPNATNLVRLIFGGAVTVTVNVHDAVRCRASVARHVIVELPTGNIPPLAGVQLTATGGTPEVPVACPYTTGMASPRGDATTTDCGHAIATSAGGGGGGGSGLVVLPPQRAVETPARTRSVRTRAVRFKLGKHTSVRRRKKQKAEGCEILARPRPPARRNLIPNR